MKKLFLFRKRFWLITLKVFLLAFVASMVALQVPELRYDLSGKAPLEIDRPESLDPRRLDRMVFASVRGSPDFERAFIYQRYGLSYTYFTVQPYGLRLVARTFEKVDEEWRGLTRLVGKLRPFDDQPFSYRIREIYRQRFQEEVPPDAYFLAIYDVPRLDGWQVGATAFAAVMWGVMFYFFFFFRPPRPQAVGYAAGSGEPLEVQGGKS